MNEETDFVVFHIQSGGIKNPNELSNKLTHNLRNKSTYNNPDININLTCKDIELISKDGIKRFYEIIKPFELEFEERQKNSTGPKKTFKDLLNNKQCAIADEIIFSSSTSFFSKLNEDQTLKYFNTCLNFANKEMGITNNLIISASIHFDEKSPHMHLIYSPLIKKMNKKIGSEVYTLSKTQFTNKHIGYLSKLHDKLADTLKLEGFNVSRGITPETLEEKKEHINHKEWKKKQRINELEKELNDYLSNNKGGIESSADKVFDTLSMLPTIYDKGTEYSVIDCSTRKLLENKSWDIRQFIKYLKAVFKPLLDYFRYKLLCGNLEEKDITVKSLEYLHCQNIYKDKELKEASINTSEESTINNYLDDMNRKRIHKKERGIEL